MKQSAAERPDPTIHRKAAIARGAALEHTGKVRIEPIPDFDLNRTIFKTLEGKAARFVMTTRVGKEAHWDAATAQGVNAEYAAARTTHPLPAVSTTLMQFLVNECDFNVEHADGSFLDHLYFCFEYSVQHYPRHSPLVMLLHSILGTGTNTFAMTADKIPQLRLALQGKVTDHHRLVLKRLLAHFDFLEQESGLLTEEITRIQQQLLPPDDMRRLDAIPGINRITIQNILAEIGPDMSVFPDAHHLCSWTGICPGNEESAGKRLRSGIRHGNRWLRRALSEAAWAASRTKNSYFTSQFRRIAARRGKKRALLAVAHSLLITTYQVLKHHKEYQDLGHDYFDRKGSEHLQRYLIRRLEALGNQVVLKPREPDNAA